ncbi:MAG TPA: MarR family winged helix-turn-helix transcriptional regulator [Microbacterium sp.]|nr:MarR family winged helix-turn-helix transcriptional regulator [Microbacterium sp.]
MWGTVVAHDTAFLLARANALSLTAVNAALEPLGLKVRSYSVLAVAVAGVRPTQRELSDFLRLDPSQIVSLIDELEKAGLATREPAQNDRRVNVVAATDEGRSVYKRAREATQRAEVECFGALGESDLAQLKTMLSALSAAG